MKRSLVMLTLLLVGGVILLLGAVVVIWINAQDQAAARREAAAQQDRTQKRMEQFAGELLQLSQDIAGGLSEGHTRRLRDWIEQEPLTLYRDVENPDRVDIEAIINALVSEVRRRGRDEAERIQILQERMEAFSRARIDAVMQAEREEASKAADAAASDRGTALVVRLSLLLIGMAVLLVLTLVWLVVGPVRRLRASVDRIAEGDLATPVPLPRGGAEELVALTHDVERMRDRIRGATEGLEEEVAKKTAALVQAAKMAGLGTLAGGVAHEFNNLIGGIVGCIESARAGSDDASVVEDLDMAQKTASRAAVLVQALLDVARPGTREMGPVQLDAVVEDVTRAAEPTATRRRVQVEREGLCPRSVHGDEGQLHQVVLNLVTNALQAVDDGGRVVIATREEDGHGVVEVRDAGPGVPEADRDRIFEPFFTGRDDGTGLGLFVSYGIVERHAGRIEVTDAPEGGAAFTVSVPFGPSAPAE